MWILYTFMGHMYVYLYVQYLCFLFLSYPYPQKLEFSHRISSNFWTMSSQHRVKKVRENKKNVSGFDIKKKKLQYCGNEGSTMLAQAISPPQMSLTMILSTCNPLICSRMFTAFCESFPNLQMTKTVGKERKNRETRSFTDAAKKTTRRLLLRWL